jgi:hypothetical protein
VGEVVLNEELERRLPADGSEGDSHDVASREQFDAFRIRQDFKKPLHRSNRLGEIVPRSKEERRVSKFLENGRNPL